jgi:hypothetical protein
MNEVSPVALGADSAMPRQVRRRGTMPNVRDILGMGIDDTNNLVVAW